jgi:hypothetical protein
MSSVRFDGYAGGYRARAAHGRTAATRPGWPRRAPLYARVLRLRAIRPGGLLCFLFFEGMIVLGALLALAELTSWWAVPVLPAAVAAMVKLNDVVTLLFAPPLAPAGARPAGIVTQRAVARGRAAVPAPRPVSSAHKSVGPNQRRFDRPIT